MSDVVISPLADEADPNPALALLWRAYALAGRGPQPGDEAGDLGPVLAVENLRVARIDGGLAGVAGLMALRMPLPGGVDVPLGGITAVAVDATHRRRGVLRALMARLTDEAIERGDPVLGLTASETTIYRRFGFGVASGVDTVRLSTRHAGFEPALDPAPGRIRRVDPDEAGRLLPGLFEASRRQRPGMIARWPRWWESVLADASPLVRQGDDGPLQAVVHDTPAGPAGYALYRVKGAWPDRLPDARLDLIEIVATQPASSLALWRHVLDVDLVGEVHAAAVAVDEPLRWRLAEPRRLRTVAHGDLLWLRPLDVASLLARRAYRVAGTVVLEVHDADRPTRGTNGRFLLDAGPGGAVCKATTRPADVRLGIAEVGSLVLGGVSARTLAAAGRLDEDRPGAVERLDDVLRWPVAPFLGTVF